MSCSENFKGSRISVLGDSVSTLSGFNPEGYRVFYQGEISEKSGVLSPSDTWWGRLIEQLGAVLLVNNSWSGSRVTKMPYQSKLFPSAVSDERIGGLGIEKTEPDIIIVNMGVNDWAYGVVMKSSRADDYYAFDFAYDLLLGRLRESYKNTELWCVGIRPTRMSSNSDFVFPAVRNNVSYSQVNRIIKDSALSRGCRYLDIERFDDFPHDTIDGMHPNADGMKLFADLLLREIKGEN